MAMTGKFLLTSSEFNVVESLAQWLGHAYRGRAFTGERQQCRIVGWMVKVKGNGAYT